MVEELKPGSLACVCCGKGRRRYRGTCDRCYHRHRLLIGAGKATWASLEAEGKSLPKQRLRLPQILQIRNDEADAVLGRGGSRNDYD